MILSGLGRRDIIAGMSGLDGRVIAITGASAGIGEACARQFARAGAHVALSARRADRLGSVVTTLAGARGRAIAVPGDVTVEADVDALIARAIETFGRLDVVIANAGAGYHGTIEETPPDVARRLMDVNYMGTFLTARAAVRAFRRQGSGHLVIVSSIVARRGISGTGAYGATKAAQLGLAESLRAELAGTGIHVTVVFPISTRTEFHDAIRRDYGHAFSGLGPQQDADDVARAIGGAIVAPRAEVYPHAMSRALAVANVIAPGLTDRLVQRFARRRVAGGPPHKA